MVTWYDQPDSPWDVHDVSYCCADCRLAPVAEIPRDVSYCCADCRLTPVADIPRDMSYCCADCRLAPVADIPQDMSYCCADCRLAPVADIPRDGSYCCADRRLEPVADIPRDVWLTVSRNHASFYPIQTFSKLWNEYNVCQVSLFADDCLMYFPSPPRVTGSASNLWPGILVRLGWSIVCVSMLRNVY